jgi:hypothetical protein
MPCRQCFQFHFRKGPRISVGTEWIVCSDNVNLLGENLRTRTIKKTSKHNLLDFNREIRLEADV